MLKEAAPWVSPLLVYTCVGISTTRQLSGSARVIASLSRQFGFVGATLG